MKSLFCCYSLGRPPSPAAATALLHMVPRRELGKRYYALSMDHRRPPTLCWTELPVFRGHHRVNAQGFWWSSQKNGDDYRCSYQVLSYIRRRLSMSIILSVNWYRSFSSTRFFDGRNRRISRTETTPFLAQQEHRLQKLLENNPAFKISVQPPKSRGQERILGKGVTQPLVDQLHHILRCHGLEHTSLALVSEIAGAFRRSGWRRIGHHRRKSRHHGNSDDELKLAIKVLDKEQEGRDSRITEPPLKKNVRDIEEDNLADHLIPHISTLLNRPIHRT